MTEAIVWTHSGRIVDLLNFKPEDFNIEDGSLGLGNLCRYNGQSVFYYSVAEHCIIASEIATSDTLFDILREAGVEPDFKRYPNSSDKGSWLSWLRLELLIHDIVEAWTGDLVGPLKPHLPRFVEIENRILSTILELHNLPPVLSPEAKAVDAWLLKEEMRVLFPMHQKTHEHFLSHHINYMNPDEARKCYVLCYQDIMKTLYEDI